MATFSTAERKRRPHGDRKSTEMTIHLKQTFEAAILTQQYPRSQIDIYVQVRAEGRNLPLTIFLLDQFYLIENSYFLQLQEGCGWSAPLTCKEMGVALH